MLSDHRLHRVLGRHEQGGRAGDIHRADVVEPALGSTEAASTLVQPSRRFGLHRRRTPFRSAWAAAGGSKRSCHDLGASGCPSGSGDGHGRGRGCGSGSGRSNCAGGSPTPDPSCRSVSPARCPRVPPVSAIRHLLPQSEGASRVVYAVAGNGSERAGTRRSAARACRSTCRCRRPRRGNTLRSATSGKLSAVSPTYPATTSGTTNRPSPTRRRRVMPRSGRASARAISRGPSSSTR